LVIEAHPEIVAKFGTENGMAVKDIIDLEDGLGSTNVEIDKGLASRTSS